MPYALGSRTCWHKLGFLATAPCAHASRRADAIGTSLCESRSPPNLPPTLPRCHKSCAFTGAADVATHPRPMCCAALCASPDEEARLARCALHDFEEAVLEVAQLSLLGSPRQVPRMRADRQAVCRTNTERSPHERGASLLLHYHGRRRALFRRLAVRLKPREHHRLRRTR